MMGGETGDPAKAQHTSEDRSQTRMTQRKNPLKTCKTMVEKVKGKHQKNSCEFIARQITLKIKISNNIPVRQQPNARWPSQKGRTRRLHVYF